MAIGQRTATQDNKGTASTTHTVTKPAGLANGDVVYIALITNGTTVSAAPAGFTQIAAVTTQSNPKFYGYRKVMTDVAGEGAWTFTMGSATSGSICQAFTGVDTTTPEDTAVQTGTGATGSATCTVTGVTTVADGAVLLYAFGVNSSTNALTGPAGMTEIAEGGARKHEMDYELRATAGATGNRAGAAASNTLAWAAWMVAIRPAVASADNIATSKPELITAPSQRARRTRAVVWQPRSVKGAVVPPPEEIVRPSRSVLSRARPRRGSIIQLRGPLEPPAAAPSTRTAPARIITGARPRRVRGTAILLGGAARIGVADPMVRPALIVRTRTLLAKRAVLQPRLGRGAKDAPVVAFDRSRPATVLMPRSRRRAVTVPPWLGKPVTAAAATPSTRSWSSLILAPPSARTRAQRCQPTIGRALRETPVAPAPRTRAAIVVSPQTKRRAPTQARLGVPVRQVAVVPTRSARPMVVLPASNPRRAQRVQPYLPDAAKSVARTTKPLTTITGSRARRQVRQPLIARRVAEPPPANPAMTRRTITVMNGARSFRRSTGKVAIARVAIGGALPIIPDLILTVHPGAPTLDAKTGVVALQATADDQAFSAKKDVFVFQAQRLAGGG